MARLPMRAAQFGKYKVLEKIGQGAMGEVFRAHDPVLGRDVAIKILSCRLDDSGEPARERFLREARAVAQLNHPNIVTVFDFGQEHEVAYMAMELLDGTDLRALIEGQKLTTLPDKLALMEQILDGMAFAHAKGLIHRDLKPGNIHVLPNGQVKIMDFGLARREDSGSGGTVLGTPYYMAPEQALTGPLTPRSDVFSLAAVFYELLTNRRPFQGASIPAVLNAVAHIVPEPMAKVAPDVPPALGRFVERALEKNPERRYADAGEMLEVLHSVWATGALPTAAGRTTIGALDGAAPRDLGPALSTRQGVAADVLAMLDEVTEYLADRVAPLMATDSVQLFSHLPAPDAAAELWAWCQGQQLRRDVRPLPDLLYQSLHKLAMIGELQLAPKEPLVVALRAIGGELATALPAGERERFVRALRHLGEAEMVRTGPLEGSSLPGPPEEPPRATPGLRRLSLLEQRLRRAATRETPKALEERRRAASQAIATAATEARSERELEGHLRRLRTLGVASAADQVFRSLGGELPDWALPKPLADTADLGPPGEVQAMGQIVALAEEPVEVASRYRHLVSAAVEQFNLGNLGGAVQMFDLASRLTDQQGVAKAYTDPVRTRGHEALDSARIRQYIEQERKDELQSVMAFFAPGLCPDTLLDALEAEARRDRRRLLLDLLLVHGAPARALANTRLLASVAEPATDFARRNWIYLLRLLPRPAAEPPDTEIETVARFASPGNPPFLIKEALLFLGHTRHPRSAQALIGLLGVWEAEFEFGRVADAARQDAMGTLDRLATALARQGDARGWRALVDHALSRKPGLGSTLDRLGELGQYDLSAAPEVVDALRGAVREAMPRGVLGRLVARREHELPALAGALVGTPTEAVRALLDEVTRRVPGDWTRATPRRFEVVARTSAGLHSGDLAPFALPGILQRVAETASTGTLTLLPREGAPATIGFLAGRPVGARWAQRHGLDAFYQLFLRPVSGRYAFETSQPPAPAPPLGDVPLMVREAMRRGRDLRRALALVPSDAALEATGSAPGTIVQEPDYDLVVQLWQQACAGVAPERLEAELGADSSRIFLPLAQWLEEGALRVVGEGEPAAEASAAS